METDRELLELAAKAAGVFLTQTTMAEVFPGFEWTDEDIPIYDNGFMVGTVAWYDNDGKPAGTKELRWNPLTDDGDALRLAVKLGMNIKTNESPIYIEDQPKSVVYITDLSNDGVVSRAQVSIEHYGDSQSATRRAIVRAAADIGKGMK